MKPSDVDGRRRRGRRGRAAGSCASTRAASPRADAALARLARRAARPTSAPCSASSSPSSSGAGSRPILVSALYAEAARAARRRRTGGVARAHARVGRRTGRRVARRGFRRARPRARPAVRPNAARCARRGSSPSNAPSNPVAVLPSGVVVDASAVAVLPFGGGRRRDVGAGLERDVVAALRTVPGLYVDRRRRRSSRMRTPSSHRPGDRRLARRARPRRRGRRARRRPRARRALACAKPRRARRLWQAQVERPVDELRAVRDEIAEQVAAAMLDSSFRADARADDASPRSRPSVSSNDVPRGAFHATPSIDSHRAVGACGRAGVCAAAGPQLRSPGTTASGTARPTGAAAAAGAAAGSKAQAQAAAVPRDRPPTWPRAADRRARAAAAARRARGQQAVPRRWSCGPAGLSRRRRAERHHVSRAALDPPCEWPCRGRDRRSCEHRPGRRYPVPMPCPWCRTTMRRIAADEWVTRVLTTSNIERAQLVPILRPLLPQSAHLAAHADINPAHRHGPLRERATHHRDRALARRARSQLSALTAAAVAGRSSPPGTAGRGAAYDRAMRIAHIEAGRHLYGGAAQVRYLTRRADGPRRRECAALPARQRARRRGARPRSVVELPMRGELDVALLPRLVRALQAAAARSRARAFAARRGSLRRVGRGAGRHSRPCSRGASTLRSRPLLARLKYRPYRAVIALSRAIERQLRDAGVAAERSAADPERRRHAALPARLGRARATARGVRLAAPTRSSSASSRSSSSASATRGCSRCCRSSCASGRSSRVVCFGRGPLEQRLRAELAERGLADRVVLAGFRADLPAAAAGPRPARASGRARRAWAWRCSRPRAPACRSSRAPSAACPTSSSTARRACSCRATTPRHCGARSRRLLGAPERARGGLGAAARRHAERRFDMARARGGAPVFIYARARRARRAPSRRRCCDDAERSRARSVGAEARPGAARARLAAWPRPSRARAAGSRKC